MANEKNGVAVKVLLGFITTLILLILGFALSGSSIANAIANNNKVDIRGMKVNQERTREDIKEIKLDIRKIMEAVVK